MFDDDDDEGLVGCLFSFFPELLEVAFELIFNFAATRLGIMLSLALTVVFVVATCYAFTNL